MNAPVPPAIPDYELLRPIGRGSYGDVWLARGVTGVWRAVKVVWRERFADAGPFEREFKGLKEFAEVSLGESIQLALLHVGRNDAAGFFYYVMELADDAERGRAIEPATYVPLTLAELRLRRGRIAVAEAVRFGVELARVLAGLHRRGLVHRDIKPSNVILVGGVPKLADIGLVAPADSARTFVGTEGYVPPEGPGTPGADVFALGKLLYELATGLDRQEFPQLPAELNRLPDHRALLALNEVILRACDPEPRPRYRDGGELLADLEALHAGRRVRRAPWGKAAALLIVGAVVGLGWWQWRLAAFGPKPPRAAPSAQTAAVDPAVAVLPFANVGGDPGQEYFSDGLTEEILNALARERGLRVPGRASSFAFKGRNLPAAEIGRALGVGQLVEGSVQRAGGRVRIRVQITRAADGFSEALGNFDRDGADVFALQDEVARAVVEKLTRRHAHARGAGLTKDAAAYDAYLRGRALHPRSAEGARAAIPFYEQAVTLDPAFALAWAHLAAARFRPYGAMDDRSPALAAAARSAIDRALALEPDLPEALIARAVWHRSVDHDYAAAQRDLERAEAQRPPTGQLRFSQATLALSQGDWASAARLAGEALALDPQNGDYTNAAAITFFSPRGEFAAADRLLERAMAIQGPGLMSPFSNRVFTRQAWRGPEAALRLAERAPAGQSGRTWVRAELLAELGRRDEVRVIIDAAERDTDPASPTAGESARVRRDASYALLAAAGRDDLVRRRAEERWTRATQELARGNASPLARNRLVDAAIALGRREDALAALEEWRASVAALPGARARIRDFGSFAIPHYARLGRADEAIAFLRDMVAQGFSGLTMLLRNRADFAPIRHDPRFQELAAQAEALARAQPDPLDP
ncbi:MAG: protein kinase [Opitutaceae bacterium]|nr:protein kinase [Opitutaceae bacterium]